MRYQAKSVKDIMSCSKLPASVSMAQVGMCCSAAGLVWQGDLALAIIVVVCSHSEHDVQSQAVEAAYAVISHHPSLLSCGNQLRFWECNVFHELCCPRPALVACMKDQAEHPNESAKASFHAHAGRPREPSHLCTTSSLRNATRCYSHSLSRPSVWSLEGELAHKSCLGHQD